MNNEQELINELQEYLDIEDTSGIDLYPEEVQMCIDALEKQTWISVEDRLPEDDERYKGRSAIDILVTTERGLVTKVRRCFDTYWCEWKWGRIRDKVLAWMPLPNKYISED